MVIPFTSNAQARKLGKIILNPFFLYIPSVTYQFYLLTISKSSASFYIFYIIFIFYIFTVIIFCLGYLNNLLKQLP